MSYRAYRRTMRNLAWAAVLAIPLLAAAGPPAAATAARSGAAARAPVPARGHIAWPHMTRPTMARSAAARSAIARSGMARSGATRPTMARSALAGKAISPVVSGRLRIAGHLRDGRVVRAVGLHVTPPPLPSGDQLLSLEVGYTWSSCGSVRRHRGHRCVGGADQTVTPFAARRYRVGHDDTGRHLEVTVTGTMVVETNPATFSFTVGSVSRSYSTRRLIRGYPAGRPPVSEFINGLPEHRTGSGEEYFEVSRPQFSSANGTPVQHYRIDHGSWRPMPRRRIFYTGKLALGPHRVLVRTANRAGATTLRFRWRVVALPAPVPCTRPHGAACWYPPHLDSTGHPMRWDWQIGRVTPLQRTGRRAVDIYDIDGFLTTRAEVSRIQHSWQAATLPHPKAVCYLDLAWEDYRPDADPPADGGSFPVSTLGKVYFGYPQERWVDFRQLDKLKPMLNSRIAMCARKGFDAVELDDIDSFDPASTTGFNLTPGDAQNYLAWAFNDVHRHGMTVLWKNTPGLSWWGVRYTDGAVVEECYVYRECFASWQAGSHQDGITCTRLSGPTPCGWDVFTADHTRRQPTGKWVGEAEYGSDHFVCNPGVPCSGRRAFATYCRQVYSPRNGFAAVKFDVDLNGRVFYPCPTGR